MYNLFSMTKVHKLYISRYDFSHTEFKLKSIHTSHSYIIHHDFSYTEFKRRFGRAQRGTIPEAHPLCSRQLLFQATLANMLLHLRQTNKSYDYSFPFQNFTNLLKDSLYVSFWKSSLSKSMNIAGCLFVVLWVIVLCQQKTREW